MEDGFQDSARNDGCAAYGTVASQTAQSEKAMIEFKESLRIARLQEAPDWHKKTARSGRLCVSDTTIVAAFIVVRR